MHLGVEFGQSVTEEEALVELEHFEKKWDELYPQISRSWRAHWHNLNTLFNYPADIRKAIYTTNAIESLNSVIRKVIKKRKLFPSDDSAKKVVYLAIQQASKKWRACPTKCFGYDANTELEISTQSFYD